jgi:hypothetical protein
VLVPSGQGYDTRLPTSPLFSLAAKTVGGRRHRVMQGREVGGVEVGHVRLEGEESMWAGFSQAMVR